MFFQVKVPSVKPKVIKMEENDEHFTKFHYLCSEIKKQMLMKKLLMVAVAAMISLSASAQHATGSFALKPTVGLTLANFTGCEVDTKM